MAGTGETPDVMWVLVEEDAAYSRAVYDTLERAEAAYTAMSNARPTGAEPNANHFARGLRILREGKAVALTTDENVTYGIIPTPLNPTQGGSRRMRKMTRRRKH